MRAIVAILKDSFREAAASRVLWVALIAIAVVLLALAPLALETSVSNRIRPSELVDVEKFLKSRSLMGTPESCSGIVEELIKIDVQDVACLIDFGPSAKAILDSLPRLASLASRFRS